MIDYVTGNNLNVFAEFQERMATSDPGEIVRLAEIRLEGRETSTKLVLPEGEDRLAVWTLLSPVEQDVVRSSKYEEKVLLLSTKAICKQDLLLTCKSELTCFALSPQTSFRTTTRCRR